MKTLASTSASSSQPEVTQLALSPDGKQLAAGHSDGTIRLWDFESDESEHPASGHRSGVSVLCYSHNGALLASGGQDTDIVVWDVTAGTPLYRLQGHLGQVTALVSHHQPYNKSSYFRPLRNIWTQCFPLNNLFSANFPAAFDSE